MTYIADQRIPQKMVTCTCAAAGFMSGKVGTWPSSLRITKILNCAVASLLHENNNRNSDDDNKIITTRMVTITAVTIMTTSSTSCCCGDGTLDNTVCCQTVLDLPQQFTQPDRGLTCYLQPVAAACPCTALATCYCCYVLVYITKWLRPFTGLC